MKILLTVHQFLPDYSSGTEVLTHSSAKELQRRGHEVTVLTGYPARQEISDEKRFDRYEHDGLPVHRFHHAYVPMGGQKNIVEAEYNNLLGAAYFRKLVANVRPDVVQFFHLSRLSAALIDVCLEAAVPMALTPTDFWFICPTCQLRLPDNSMCTGPKWLGANCLKHVTVLTQRGKVAKMVARLPEPALAAGILGLRAGLLPPSRYAAYVTALAGRAPFLRSRINRVDRILAPTRLMASMLKNNGVDASRIAVCRYGIDLPPNIGEPQTVRGAAARLRVGFIGTLYEHKGAHVLLEAMKRIPAAPIEVSIYGKLGEFPEYTERLRELSSKDERVRFMGTFPNSEIGAVFGLLDALVVPSIWYENTPLVIYSANAFGCPVIASNLGGMSEAINDGTDGFLFPPSDSGALAQILERLAEDRGLIRSLSAACKPPKSSAEYVDDLERTYAFVREGRATGLRGTKSADAA